MIFKFRKILYILSLSISLINLEVFSGEKFFNKNKLLTLENNNSARCINEKFSTEEIIKIMENKVVTVYTFDNQGESISSGSGFVVSHHNGNTFILTNSHVIEDAKSIYIKWVDGNSDKAIIEFDAGGSADINDIALLKVKGIEGKPVLIKKEPAVVGRDVIAIGSPWFQEYSVSRGIISSIRDKGTLIQTDTTINQGNSGGPLFETSGCVVGMNTYGLTDGVGLNFSISNKVINRFIRKFLPDYSLRNKEYNLIPANKKKYNTKQNNSNIEQIKENQSFPQREADLDYFFFN